MKGYLKTYKQLKKLKLKAFTLVEILIVLILSTIMVSVIYLGYDLINKYFKKQLQTATYINTVNQFKTIFKRDIENAEKIFLEQNTIKLQNRKDHVYYFFPFSGVAIRNISETSDTFKVNYAGISYFLNKKQINKNSIIDNIMVELCLFSDTIKTSFNKEYGAAIKMKYY